MVRARRKDAPKSWIGTKISSTIVEFGLPLIAQLPPGPPPATVRADLRVDHPDLERAHDVALLGPVSTSGRSRRHDSECGRRRCPADRRIRSVRGAQRAASALAVRGRPPCRRALGAARNGGREVEPALRCAHAADVVRRTSHRDGATRSRNSKSTSANSMSNRRHRAQRGFPDNYGSTESTLHFQSSGA